MTTGIDSLRRRALSVANQACRVFDTATDTKTQDLADAVQDLAEATTDLAVVVKDLLNAARDRGQRLEDLT